MRIIIARGLPASGKSTWAKEKIKQDKNWIRVNKDELRAMLYDEYRSKGEGFILEVRDFIITRALEQNKNIIVDDTNFNPIHVDRISEVAEPFKADVSIKFFEVELEEAIRRDLNRERSVGKDVIVKMYNQYLKPRPVKYEPPKNKPKAIMVDVDGTLAHMWNRGAYDWSKVARDKVDNTIANLVKTLKDNGFKIIIMTGRDGEAAQDTISWLAVHKIPYDAFMYRRAGDNRKDYIVKKELFDNHVRDEYQIEFVLDDRNQVVDMWRNQVGLKVLQVAEGDF